MYVPVYVICMQVCPCHLLVKIYCEGFRKRVTHVAGRLFLNCNYIQLRASWWSAGWSIVSLNPHLLPTICTPFSNDDFFLIFKVLKFWPQLNCSWCVQPFPWFWGKLLGYVWEAMLQVDLFWECRKGKQNTEARNTVGAMEEMDAVILSSRDAQMCGTVPGSCWWRKDLSGNEPWMMVSSATAWGSCSSHSSLKPHCPIEPAMGSLLTVHSFQKYYLLLK